MVTLTTQFLRPAGSNRSTARQFMIDMIEGHVGTLASVPWNKVSSNDLYTLSKATWAERKVMDPEIDMLIQQVFLSAGVDI